MVLATGARMDEAAGMETHSSDVHFHYLLCLSGKAAVTSDKIFVGT